MNNYNNSIKINSDNIVTYYISTKPFQENEKPKKVKKQEWEVKDMTDVRNWTNQDKQNFIKFSHDLDNLPKDYHLLHNPATIGMFKTCEGCYTVKGKKEFAKKQWKSKDSHYCFKCIDEVVYGLN